MERQSVMIHNKSGLHARPAANFAKTAKKFQSKVTIKTNGSSINGRSIVSILSAGIMCKSQIEIQTEGEDEKEALSALVTLVQAGCGETE